MDFHDQLDVFLNENKIGTLFTDNGVMSFAYDTEFLNTPGAYPLSKNLPLKEGFFTDPEVEGFFSNLLPDERIRNTVAMILHVSPGNTFRLLKEIGADCAGAVSFYPQGETPQSANNPVYRKLSAEEAYKILDNLGQRPLDVGDEGVRISGAGSQEKLVACVQNGAISLPLYGTPSTHIIKPVIPNFQSSVHNEYFCMKLAKAMGLPVAECDILTIDDDVFYVVERFDRSTKNGITRRLHQEDFCQLLNVPPHLKYEEDGGPGVKDCLQCMSDMHISAMSRLQFIRLLIFNFLIGNCDAHAKNYAVLYNNGIPSFAPAYDLLCTMVYETMSRCFAMSVGGENRMGMLKKEHFIAMAEECGLNPKMVLAELDSMAAKLPDIADKLDRKLNAVHPSTVYGSVAWQVKHLCLQIAE